MITKLKNLLKNIYPISSHYRRGLFAVPFNKLIINFVFQRIFFLNWRCKTSVNFTSTVLCPENLSLGNFSAKSLATSPNLYIQAFNGIKIEENVLIGPSVSIISANHDPVNRSKWIKMKSIKIESDVWIGAHVTILPETIIGKGSIVAANSVVRGAFPPNSLIAGTPARVLKAYND